jgi:hypothetical protein
LSTRFGRAEADISGMELALSSALPSEPETHHVLRDGNLVAVVKTLATGSAFTVVAEIIREAGEAAPIRPHTFERREDASAFVAELANSFAYLGCEIRSA